MKNRWNRHASALVIAAACATFPIAANAQTIDSNLTATQFGNQGTTMNGGQEYANITGQSFQALDSELYSFSLRLASTVSTLPGAKFRAAIYEWDVNNSKVTNGTPVFYSGLLDAPAVNYNYPNYYDFEVATPATNLTIGGSYIAIVTPDFQTIKSLDGTNWKDSYYPNVLAEKLGVYTWNNSSWTGNFSSNGTTPSPYRSWLSYGDYVNGDRFSNVTNASWNSQTNDVYTHSSNNISYYDRYSLDLMYSFNYAPSQPLNTTINDPQVPTLLSQINSGINPAFNGGRLVLDLNYQFINYDFTLDNNQNNTFEANGMVAYVLGMQNEVSGTGGNINFTDGVGGGQFRIRGAFGAFNDRIGTLTNSADLFFENAAQIYASGINNSGRIEIQNGGLVDDDLANTGIVINGGTYNANVSNSGVGAQIINNGIWNGNLTSNTDSAEIDNVGQWNGDADNTSLLMNHGTWVGNLTNNLDGTFENYSQWTGNVTNNGTVDNKSGGVIDGQVVNYNALINAGTINNTTGYAVTGNGTITNTGTIHSTVDDAVYQTSNITNAGTISSDVFSAVTVAGRGVITNAAAGTLTGGSNASFGYGAQFAGETGTFNNYGIANGTAGGVLANNNLGFAAPGDSLTINLYAGSTTGNINLAGSGGPIDISLHTGMGTSNAGLNVGGIQLQNAGTLAAASFGNIFGGSGRNNLYLRGTGDGTAALGAIGTLNIGSISNFSDLLKTDTGTWQLTGSSNGSLSNIYAGLGSPAGKLQFNTTGLIADIFVNGATIQANSAGAFGSGTIHMIDPTVQFSANGTYSNDFSLEVATGNVAADPATFLVDTGVTAFLSGKVTQSSNVGVDPNQDFVKSGSGTLVLQNSLNNWSGVTKVLAGRLAGETGTISGASIVNNGIIEINQLASGTLAQAVSGNGSIETRSTLAGNTINFAGNLTGQHVYNYGAGNIKLSGTSNTAIVDNFISGSTTTLAAGSTNATTGGLSNFTITNGVTFDNYGTGTSTNTNVVYAQNGGHVINNATGTLSATGAGRGIFGDGSNGTIVDNYGTISSNSTLWDAIDLISTSSNNFVHNAGTITSLRHGVALYGGNLTNDATGVISTSTFNGGAAVYISNLASNSVITNAGQLTSTAAGGYGVVSFGSNTNVNNNAGGLIRANSGGRGVYFANNIFGNLTNRGTIQGATGVYASNGLNLTNYATGVITATGNGNGVTSIGSNAAIVNNYGTITSTANGYNGIHLTSAGANSVYNAGTINSNNNGIYVNGGNVTNDTTGNINVATASGATGIYVDSGAVNSQVVNNGHITSTGPGGNGILSFGSNTNVTNSSTGVISAVVGADSWGVAFLTNSGTLTNSGSITADVGVYSGNGLNLTNNATGSITGLTTGVRNFASAINVTNNGLITGGLLGIYTDRGGTITNNIGGVISGGVGGNGINSLNAITNIYNHGTISSTSSGGASGIAMQFAGANVLNNTGSIVGGTNGVFMAGGTLTNSGTITGNSLNGVRLTSAALNAIINNSGTISSLGSGAAGILGEAANLSINNNLGGAIEALAAAGSNSTGVKFTAADATLINSGAISGDIGVSFAAGGTLTNNATGSITGTTTGILIDNAAVNLTQNGTVSGGTDAIRINGIFNSDIVLNNGSNTQGNIVFGDGNDSFTLMTGAFFQGIVDGRLGSDSYTLNGTGTDTVNMNIFSNFESRSKIGSGTWTLIGNDNITADFNLVEGTLNLNGGSAINDLATLNMSSGTNLNLHDYETIGALNGYGSINLNLYDLGINGSVLSEFYGVISGGGGLNKYGNEDLVLYGNNTYLGMTNVNSGLLRIYGAIQHGVNNSAHLYLHGTLNGNITNNANSIFTVADNSTSNGVLTNQGYFSVANGVTYSGLTAITNNSSEESGMDIFGTLNVSGDIENQNGSSVVVRSTGTLNAQNIYNRSGASIYVMAGGNVVDDLYNSGVVSNSGTYTADVNNTGAAALITNQASGQWYGDVLTNNTGAIIINDGHWNGSILHNSSEITNNNYWLGVVNNSAGGLVQNFATWRGSFTNSGEIINYAAGDWRGTFTNNVASSFTNYGYFFDNTESGPENYNSGTLENFGTIEASAHNYNFLRNNLGATWFGAIVENSGNAAWVENNGDWYGDADNNAIIRNTGTWHGFVTAHDGTINNTGTWDGNVINDGGEIINNNDWTGNLVSNTGSSIVTNNGTWTGDADNGASITVSATGTWNGNLLANTGTVGNFGAWNGNVVSNTLNGLIQNSGTWTGDVSNSAVVNNTNLASWNGNLTNDASGIVQNGGTWNGTADNAGTINVTATGEWVGNLASNTGDVANGGIWNGTADNAGTINVTATGTWIGDLASNTGDVTNNGTWNGTADNAGTINVTATGTWVGDLIGNTGDVTNDGTWNGNLTSNSPTGSVANNGTWNGTARNNGTITNTLGATWNGALTNNSPGNVSNYGTWLGDVTNNLGGFITNGGTITGNANNSSSIINLAAGIWNGNLTNNSGTVVNIGAWNGNANIIGGILSNHGALNGTVLNNADFINGVAGSVSGLVTNNSALNNAGVFNGGLLQSAGTATNSGTINGGATVNAGTLNTSGTINGGATINGGTLNTSGTINGGLVNSAIVNASGAINGAVLNQNSGAFNVTGALTGNSSFTNNGTAVLTINSGTSYTGLTSILNNSSATNGIGILGTLSTTGRLTNAFGSQVHVGSTGLLTAANVTNNGLIIVDVGGRVIDALTNTGTVNNSGTYTADVDNTGATAIIYNNATGVWNGNLLSNTGAALVNNYGTWNGNINNASTFGNAAGAIVSGLATNSNALYNLGTINGGLLNLMGTTINSGTINGGATISGGVLASNGIVNGGANIASGAGIQASNQVNGNITNAGGFLVTGNLTNNGGTFNNSATGLLVVGANSFTGIGALSNAAGGQIGIGTASANGILGAASFANSGLATMLTGRTGDAINLSGAYTGGATSVLGFDVNMSNNLNQSDKMNTSGHSGTTIVAINNIGSSRIFLQTPIILVSSATGTGNFVASNDVATTNALSSVGIVNYALRNTSAGNWGIVSELNNSLASSPSIAASDAVANTLSQYSAMSYNSTSIIPKDKTWNGRMWGVLASGLTSNDHVSSSSDAFSKAKSIESELDLTFVRFGFDGAFRLNDGSVTVGIDGGLGYATTNMGSEIGVTDIDYDFLGVHGNLDTPIADIDFAASKLKLNVNPNDVINTAETEGDGWLASLSIAKNIEVSKVRYRPFLRIAQSSFTLNDSALVGGMGKIDFNDMDSKINTIGINISKIKETKYYEMRPYLEIGYNDNSASTLQSVFVPIGGSSNVGISASETGDYAHLNAGFTAKVKNSNMEIFGNIGAVHGSNLSGGNLSIGAKMKF